MDASLEPAVAELVRTPEMAVSKALKTFLLNYMDVCQAEETPRPFYVDIYH